MGVGGVAPEIGQDLLAQSGASDERQHDNDVDIARASALLCHSWSRSTYL
jgi:hypothetical protein